MEKNKVINSAVELCLEARKSLMGSGMCEADAISKVRNNFERCNNSGAVITLEELCKG